MSDLRELLSERIDALSTTPGDLDAVRTDGRRIRVRRRLAAGAAMTAVVAVVGAGVAFAGRDDGTGTVPTRRDETGFSSLTGVDFSAGVRAYGDATFLSLGGQRFPADKLSYLDTDAVAMPQGVVFYDHGRPTLIDGTGAFTPLVQGPVDDVAGFHPTAKADAAGPLVAFAIIRKGEPILAVRDLDRHQTTITTLSGCGRCTDLVIDALDGGVVFVRDRNGTRTWDSVTGKWQDFAGPDTRVADVRSGVVLYDGPAPTTPGDWRLVRGGVDAQLTLDGEHVLSWSSTLAPTEPGGTPLVLDRGPAEGQASGQWTIDSDGSVLLITRGSGQEDVVYDCAIPSGACEEIDSFVAEGGDPLFLGNDM